MGRTFKQLETLVEQQGKEIATQGKEIAQLKKDIAPLLPKRAGVLGGSTFGK
jgi:hypothetical protein